MKVYKFFFSALFSCDAHDQLCLKALCTYMLGHIKSVTLSMLSVCVNGPLMFKYAHDTQDLHGIHLVTTGKVLTACKFAQWLSQKQELGNVYKLHS